MPDTPHSPKDFAWAIPFMRAGYTGRGITYLAVAGLSLATVWAGGNGLGTSEALSEMATKPGGTVALVMIALGLLAYCVWRLTCAWWDLEDYGTDAKGMVARAGQVVTGLIHGALGILAATTLMGRGSEDGSGFARIAAAVMSAPAGLWLLGAAGLATIGAGIYYIHKGWSEGYRKELRANWFTLHTNWLMKGGLMAQGAVIAIIGGFILYAAYTANPNEAGGLGQTFDWLRGQPYGQALVTLLCLGLLGFAVFCLVNAVWRIVPKAAGDDITSVARKLKLRAEAAAETAMA